MKSQELRDRQQLMLLQCYTEAQIKDVTYYDKRREEMRVHIKAVFEESRQLFGADKVSAVLIDRGFRTMPKYVAELMREMDLHSVRQDSRRAFESRNRPENLTFHSDRGVQYTSKAFQKLLRVNKVVQSFSNIGKPRDNAVAEAFFASLKREELYRTNYKSESEFRKSVEDYMLFYNTKRPHETLAYKTPDRFEKEYG